MVNLALYVSLDEVTWVDSKKQSTSPYLWTAFFTIDSNGVTLFSTQGNHRDLGVATVHSGAVMSISDALGYFIATVTPLTFGNTTIGQFGAVAVVLKDGGHITPHGIQAGHVAFNAGLQEILQSLYELGISQGSSPTQDQITAAITAENLPERVKSAVENAQNFWDNLWSLTGEDSFIGYVVNFWNVSDFMTPAQTQNFALSFQNSATSTWTFTGSATVADQCPASSSTSLLKKQFASGTSPEVEAHLILDEVLSLMRDFRAERGLLKNKSFAQWWNLVKRSTPELACRLAQHKEVREAMLPMIEVLVEHLRDEEKVISVADLDTCIIWAQSVQKVSSSKLAGEMAASVCFAKRMEGRTLSSMLRIVAMRQVESSDF